MQNLMNRYLTLLDSYRALYFENIRLKKRILMIERFYNE